MSSRQRSSGILFGMPWLSPIVIPDGTFATEELKIFVGFYFITSNTVVEKKITISLRICSISQQRVNIVHTNNIKVIVNTFYNIGRYNVI